MICKTKGVKRAMQNKGFIPSKYNNLVFRKNTLRLYNSFVGTDSFVIVGDSKREKILAWLEGKEYNSEDDDFKLLCEKGYFVSADIDEKIRTDVAYNEIVFDPSLILIILPTEVCNFKCGYCYEAFQKGAMGEDVQKGIIKYVKRNISSFTKIQVGWFGGEPTLAMDVVRNLSIEFKKICKVAKKTYSASMTTNGYNLTRELFLELLSLGVRSFQITLDGPREIHDRLRPHESGKGSFDVILNNMLKIKESVETPFFQICIRINFSNLFTEKQIREYLDMLYKLFGDDKRFEFSVHFAANWGGDRVDGISDVLMEQSREVPKVINIIAESDSKLNFDYHLMDFKKEGICSANRKNQFIIGSDGNIYKCTANFNDDHVIGHIDESGVMEIDEGKHLPWISRDRRKKELCEKCSFYGCCMASTCPEHYVFREEMSSNCPRTKLFLDQYIQLIDEKHFAKII